MRLHDNEFKGQMFHKMSLEPALTTFMSDITLFRKLLVWRTTSIGRDNDGQP